VEMLPQFGNRRRVEQSKSHQAADLTSADRRGNSTAQTRGPIPDPADIRLLSRCVFYDTHVCAGEKEGLRN
jgi:hypothetical protein